jgi:hypothetical protein
VKVGRTALDEAAMRRIEQQNPDIEFDWPRILKGGGSPATEPRPPIEIRRGRQNERRDQQSSRQQPSSPPRPADVVTSSPRSEVVPSSPDTELRERDALSPAVEINEVNEVNLPSDAAPPPIAEVIDTPAHARIGAEGVARLRARYAEIRSRIAERISDPARRDELGVTAERLNPDTWKTADEVTAGLEQYEAVLASLRDVIGRRRRKRRRGGRRDQAAAAAAQGSATESSPDEDAGDEPEDEGADSGENDSGGGES